MDIDTNSINKLAQLSKLSFSEEEQLSLKSDLEKMLQFVEKMKEVNTDDVEPLLHISSTKNIFREDVVTGMLSTEDALKNASNSKDPFFVVPKVIKK